jgi:ketol-acid reductoisomerase
VIDEETKQSMKDILREIQDGTFAKRFIADQDDDAPEFNAMRKAQEEHQIEDVGRELRALMAWVGGSEKDFVEGTAARK